MINIFNLVFVLAAWLSNDVALADPLSPQESLHSFQLADPSLTIELVASEPQIEEPVAMAFDEDGRLYVAEMRGFQQGPDFKGIHGISRIKQLEDRDGDGFYEHSTIFADNLNYPTAVMPAYGGLVVGCAPDILFFKDTDGDGRADERKVIFTGFWKGDHEQLLNSFQWGLDNWIHAAGGGVGGEVNGISIGTRNFRFRLSPNGGDPQFELTSGVGQFGLTSNDWGDWFTCSNARHLIQIVLPDEYLRRNPALAVPQVSIDIPDHGAAAQIYRISPFEEWRVARTKLRAATRASEFIPSELQPGGYFTAACGLTVYRGDLLPKEYYGDVFVCDASNNLVHRDRLVPDSVTFIAKRVDNQRQEFLASTDNWFRPVTATYGPDGALYIVDMYREMIETPTSIPPDIRKTINMENGKDMGRIYRIRPKYSPPPSHRTLSKASTSELVQLLGHPNAWRRITAQRLIVERQDHSTVTALSELVLKSQKPLARLHALCTLDGLRSVLAPLLVKVMKDTEPRMRQHALRLSRSYIYSIVTKNEAQAEDSRDLLPTMLTLIDDPSSHVRFQLAFCLGEISGLAKLAQRDMADPWIRTAILSSVDRPGAEELWHALHAKGSTIFSKQSDGATALSRELMTILAAEADAKSLADTLDTFYKTTEPADTWWRSAGLIGLSDGMERSGKGKNKFTSDIPYASKTLRLILRLIADKQTPVRRAARQLATHISWPNFPELNARIAKDATIATDDKQELSERISAIAMLGCGKLTQVAKPLETLIAPDQPVEIQKAAVAALASIARPEAAVMLLARSRWQSYTPDVRDAVVSVVLTRAEYLAPLLDAIENGDVPAWAIDAAHRTRLLEHSDEKIRARAKKILTSPTNADRQKIYDQYKEILNLAGNAFRGKNVFKTNCSACHQLEGVGHAVGPDLAALRDREPAALLSDIIMPSQTLTAGYSYYVIDTADDESLSGLIAGESASAITLRQREGVERTILRSNVKSLYASSVSMMPEDLEKTINLEQMADLIAYLKSAK